MEYILLILFVFAVIGGAVGVCLGMKWENTKVLGRSRYFLGICGILLIVLYSNPIPRIIGTILIIKAIYVFWWQYIVPIYRHLLKKENK